MSNHGSNGRQRRAPPQRTNRQSNRTNSFACYELLKAEFTATATSPVEYEAACRKAAKLAGV